MWQHSGEDWEDISLFFSTQRPSLGAMPPGLSRDFLSAEKKKDKVEIVTRDPLQTLSGGGKQTPTELPGIDDGGHVLSVAAQGRFSLPSDGWPVRVPLADFAVETELQRWFQGEAQSEVLLKTTQENRGALPILAGPVDLVMNSGLQGRTQVAFVAPGEEFTLGWGPDPMVRGERTVAQGEEEKEMMSGWFKTRHTIEIYLGNLSQEGKTLKVRERTPVSEVKQVEVAVDAKKTTDNAAPDENGFVEWTVELGPRGRKVLQLDYVMKRRKEVVGV